MASSPDDVLIETALQDFYRQIHLAFPLRNFGEFHNDEQLKERILQLMENVSKNFFSKLGNRDREQVFSLLMKLRERMSKEVIAEWKVKNEKRKNEFISYLQKYAEMVCEDFQMALEDQLLLNPEMEMNSLQEFVDHQKVFALHYFDVFWKPGNSQIKNERRAKMIKNLDAVGEEKVEKHKHNLEMKSINEGKTLVDEVFTIIMEKTRQLKFYVGSHPERVSKLYLKVEVENMKEYLLNGKGLNFKESQEEIFSKLMETLEDGIKFLTEEEGAEGKAKSPEDFIQWMERFDLKLKSYCSNDGGRNEAQGIQQERNGYDSSERRNWMRMRQILKEGPFGFWEQEEPEPERRKHDMTESNAAEKELEIVCVNKTGSKADDGSGPSSGAKRRFKRRRSLAFPVNLKTPETDEDGETLMGNDKGNSHDPEYDGPPLKSHKTCTGRGRNVYTTTTTVPKAVTSVHRPISGVNDKASNACPVNPRRSRRIKKNVRESDRTMKMTGTPNPSSSSSRHGEKSNGITSTETLIKHSKGKRPQSHCRSTDKSACAVGKRSPRNIICPDQITSLGGDPPTFQCDVCKKEIRVRSSLRYHGKFCYEAHQPKQAFTCGTCQRSFTYLIDLKRHVLYHGGKLPFACCYCEQRCVGISQMKAHVLTHADEQERPYLCITCKKQFCVRHQLVRHIQRAHRQPKQDAIKQTNDAAVDYLRKVTKNPNYDGDISDSVVLSHAIKEAKLRICEATDDDVNTSPASATPSTSTPRKYSAPSYLPKFTVSFDQITKLGGDVDPTYKCDVCGTQFKRKCFLKNHGKNCHRRDRKCHHCGKEFRGMSALVLHLRSHTGEKPFKCSTCEKQFAHKSNLQAHMRSHTSNNSNGEAPFTCDKCKQGFCYRVNLERHMLKHDGKLPFGCHYCDARCATMSLMKEHVLIHCDERPFECPTCERPFAWKPTLIRHIRRIHHQPIEDARKLANEAAANYLRKVTKNPNYDGDISTATVLSHVFKKTKLKIPEKTAG